MAGKRLPGVVDRGIFGLQPQLSVATLIFDSAENSRIAAKTDYHNAAAAVAAAVSANLRST
jgi:hypothetical protein